MKKIYYKTYGDLLKNLKQGQYAECDEFGWFIYDDGEQSGKK